MKLKQKRSTKNNIFFFQKLNNFGSVGLSLAKHELIVLNIIFSFMIMSIAAIVHIEICCYFFRVKFYYVSCQ